jgi:hypothetical protein
LTLDDLRRLAKQPAPRTRDDWEGRVYARLLALPEQTEPLQRAQLAAAISVGNQIIRLRNVAPRLNQSVAVDSALNAIADGRSVAAVEQLGQIDRALAASSSSKPGMRASLRTRAGILAMSEALTEFTSYFDSRALA